MNKTSQIAVALMVKNEQGYAIRSLESVKSYLGSVVILDTGSTDNTIKEIEEWCFNNKKPLYLKQEEFVDFSTSRNTMLEFAEDNVTEQFILLLDANDELRGDWDCVLKEVNSNANVHGALLRQIWKHGENQTVYYNVRLIRRGVGWRYKGAVHEYINKENPNLWKVEGEDKYIYQNRDDDGGKTASRLQQDYQVLLNSVKKNPSNARDMFYLARTCETIQRWDEAITYFERRTTMKDFIEEVFWSYMSLARIHLQKGHEYLAVDYYARAFNTCKRVEPLVELTRYYMARDLKEFAYLYAHMAGQLQFPHELILFIDKHQYDYMRWHMLGIVCYYVGAMKEGEAACRLAIAADPNGGKDVDKANLEFYLKKD